jgi:hypothetical protein
MIGAIAYWMAKWFFTVLAGACFIQMIRAAFNQASGRTASAILNGTVDVAGSAFAFAVFTSVAIALWFI